MARRPDRPPGDMRRTRGQPRPLCGVGLGGPAVQGGVARNVRGDLACRRRIAGAASRTLSRGPGEGPCKWGVDRLGLTLTGDGGAGGVDGRGAAAATLVERPDFDDDTGLTDTGLTDALPNEDAETPAIPMTTALRTAFRLHAAALAVAAGLSAAGAAQAADPVKLEVTGEASVVAGVVRGDAKDGLRADGDATLTVKGSTVLDNGIEIGAVVQGRADGDQPAQLYGGGRYSSYTIGGPRGVAPASGDVWLEGAYAYARGGFGQLIVGRDQGVARTLAVTAPTIFRAVNINDWKTDLTGLNDVHTVNDFSGRATKITYMPPANMLGGVLGGLQLGVSYAPSLRDCGERLCAPEAGLPLITPEDSLLAETSRWQNVFEGAFFYQRRLGASRNSPVIGLGASYVSADEDARSLAPAFGDYRAYSVGLNLAFRGITIGGSVKSTNAGLSGLADDGYLAFDAGLTYRTGEGRGDWGFMLGYGQSEANVITPDPMNPLLFRDTQTAQAGVTYYISRGFTVGAAAQFVESTKPAAAGGPEEATTVVIESSIKF